MSVDIASPTEPLENRTGRERKLPTSSDTPYRSILIGIAIAVAAILALFFVSIVKASIPGWRIVGWHFFYGSDWNFSAGQYGALPLILGTFVTTGFALVFAVPIGIGSALAITYLIPRRFRLVISSLVELLAVVPSIIYGTWGFLVIGPWLGNHLQPWLASLTGGRWPFNGVAQSGSNLLLGVIVLGVMILPTMAAISRDVFMAVPNELIEGGLSVGATRSQVLLKVVLPSSRTGLLGAAVLATGRALGETIAMVFLLGGVNAAHPWPINPFNTGATLASEIAANFGNYSGTEGFGILSCLALVLMVIVGAVNLLARVITSRSRRKLLGA